MKIYTYNIEDMPSNQYEEWLSLVSDERHTKLDRLWFVDDRKCSLAGEVLARKGISKELGIPPEKIVFGKTKTGKPTVMHYPIEFNISHSAEYVVCAISKKPIGIDIEKIRPVRMTLTKKFCTNDEKLYIFGKKPSNEDFLIAKELIPEDTRRRFFEVWTAKEALLKQTGEGLKGGMLSFSVINSDGEIGLDDSSLSIESVEVSRGYVCTVVYEK